VLRVEGLGIGIAFRVYGCKDLGCRDKELGLRIEGLRLRFEGLRFKVEGLGFRDRV